jgi:hypothetical protein
MIFENQSGGAVFGYGGTLMDYVNIVLPILGTLAGAIVGSALGFWNSTRLEKRKEGQIRRNVAIVLQAELIRLHGKIKDHNTLLLQPYSEKFSREVNYNEASKYVPLSLDGEFIVYVNCIKDLGLLSSGTASQLVYLYANVREFSESQTRFLTKLPSIVGSTIAGIEATNLSAKEVAVLEHIERIVPLLASQSEPLPFARTDYVGTSTKVDTV